MCVTGLKEHMCSLCDNRFTRASTLKTHVMMHYDITKYQCEIEDCGKRFRSHTHYQVRCVCVWCGVVVVVVVMVVGGELVVVSVNDMFVCCCECVGVLFEHVCACVLLRVCACALDSIHVCV